MLAVQKRVNFYKNLNRIKILEHYEIKPARVKIELANKSTFLSLNEIRGILDELKVNKIKNIHLIGCDNYNKTLLTKALRQMKGFHVTLEIKNLTNCDITKYLDRVVLVFTRPEQIVPEAFSGLDHISVAVAMELNSSIRKSLEEVYKRMDGINIEEWFFKRTRISKDVMIKAITEIIRLNRKYNQSAFIASPVPFCIHDADEMCKVCIGGFNEGGYTDLTIDARGRIRPDINENTVLGVIKAKSISVAWNSEHMQRIRQFKNVAKMCLYCNYLFVCGGGKIDKFTPLSYFPTDPLVEHK